MPIDAFDALINDAVTVGVDSVSLSGGEPFTIPMLKDYLYVLSAHSVEYVSFITNGTLISSNMIHMVQQFIKRPLYQISIDGIGSDHDALRGKGCYEKVVKSLDLLRQSSANFYFHSVIHSNNYTHLKDIAQLALKYSVRNIDFTFLKRKGRGKDSYSSLQISSKDRIRCIKELLQIKDEYSPLGLQINPPSVFYGRCPIYTGDDFNFNLSPRIDVFGNAFACQNVDCECLELGNINNQRLNEIFSEENIKKQRQSISQIENNQQCNNCFLNYFCGRGCPGLEYSDYVDIFSEDCAERKNYALSILNDMIKEK